MVTRLPVRLRLLITFAGAALFAIGASATGLLSFQEVQRAQRTILEDHVPTQAKAQALAQSAQSLAAAAPLLVIAKTDSERASALDRIEARISRLDALLVQLSERVADRRFLKQLVTEKDALVKALRALNYRVDERILSDRRIHTAMTRGRHILEDAARAITDLMAPPDAARYDPAADTTLKAARLAIEQARVALEQVPLASPAGLSAARDAYQAALTRGRAHLLGLPLWFDRTQALALVGQAESLIDGGSGDPFSQRGRQDLAQRRADALLEAYTQQAFRMVFSASALAQDTNAAMTSAGETLGIRLSTTSGVLWAIAGLSVLGALLLAIYADRVISDRLALLRRNMADHAAGARTPVPDLGGDEIGDMARALTVFVDTIVEREAALKSSEAHLRAVIDAVPEGILSVDSAGVILSASRTAEHLFSYSRPLAGLSINRLLVSLSEPEGAGQASPDDSDSTDLPTDLPLPAIRAATTPALGIPNALEAPPPPPDAPPHPAAHASLLTKKACSAILDAAERALAPLLVTARRADGSVFPAELTAHRVDGQGTTDRFFVVTLRDVTERARTETERQRILALLAAAQEVTAEGLMVSDPEGAIITCNRKFYALFGLDPAVLSGQPRATRLARVASVTTDPDAFLTRIQDIDRDPSLVALDRIALADGRLLERYSAPFRVAGAIAGRIWSLRDITEQHRAQEDLKRAKEEAELALTDLKATQNHLVEAGKMASLGHLVAGIAHEVNTPVGITVTAASFIADEVRELEALQADGRLGKTRFAQFLDSVQESAGLVLSNAQRAAELIQSFKQVAVDQTSDERRRFDLGDYVHEILISLGPSLRTTPHKVHATIPAGIQMNSYPGALSQIVANLVINALTHAFAPDQTGTLVITARTLEGNRVELVFADNGQGMTEEVRRRIFDPFFTTRRGQGGSGLGLNIVYNLATRTLGGRIDVVSAPGQGSTFTLAMPRVTASAAPEPESPA